MTWPLVIATAASFEMVWCTCGWIMIWSHTPSRYVTAIFHEGKYFYLPATALKYWGYVAVSHHPLRWYEILMALADIWVWWSLTRNVDDDDDRWKRRREKLSGVVKQVGAKLVVEPAGQAA